MNVIETILEYNKSKGGGGSSGGGGTSITVDSALSTTSSNPVQNRIVTNAINNKANLSHTHTVSDITDLDTSNYVVKSDIEQLVQDEHTHNNKDTILDKFTLDENNNLLFNNEKIEADFDISKVINDNNTANNTTWSSDKINKSIPKTWVGTRTEYEQIKNTLENGTIVYITDDEIELNKTLDDLKSKSHIHNNKDTLDSLSVSDSNKLLFNGKDICKDNIYQYSTMPVASANNVDTVAQYTGITNGDYTHNYFYECTKANDGTYKWVNVKVQSGNDSSASIDDTNVSDSTTYSSTKITNDFYTKANATTDLSNKVDTTTFETHTNNADVHISAVDRAKWDNKSDFDGKYTSLTDTPTIPTVDVNKEYVDTELTKKVNVADMPTNVSTFTNDSKYQTETDVTNTLATYAKKTEIPTNISALTNDSNFITNAVDSLVNYYTKTETYSQAEINTLLGNLTGKLSAKIVTELPTETSEISTSTMYLIAVEEQEGTYAQYMYIDNAWASLGKTTVDLTNYYSKTEVDTKLSDKADKASIPVIPTNVSAFTNDSGYLTEHQSLDGYAKTNEIPTVTNDLTNELKANYDLAFTQTHTHSNKELLDNLTTETIAKYDNAVTNSHTHANSDVLNTLSADNITNWDKAYTDSHTHTNKDELDSLTKSKLDDYDNAVVNTHSHANKTVLDNFSTADDGTLLYNNENIKGVELDDEVVSKTKVWSSSKIDDTIIPIAEKAHTHTNQTVIDKFTENENGEVQYNNEVIKGNVWTGTKAEYDAIKGKDSKTTYIVTDEEETLADYVIDDTITDANKTWSSQKINETTKEVYSTDEVKTNKVWIDGKPIYRKVTTQTITTPKGCPIDNFDTSLVDSIISIYGSIKQPSGNITPISFYNKTEDGAYVYMSKEINRFILFARELGIGDVILIVEYTKTTD